MLVWSAQLTKRFQWFPWSTAFLLLVLLLAVGGPSTVAAACSYLEPELLPFDYELVESLCFVESSRNKAWSDPNLVASHPPPATTEPRFSSTRIFKEPDRAENPTPKNDSTGGRETQTVKCPLNGASYPVSYQAIWERRRPLGIMIENHPEARPQYGLSSADVVYEVVAEGGITRFLAVFYCDRGAEPVRAGPVRSARTYFLDWLYEYGRYPLYAHVGGAYCDRRTGIGCLNGARADALGQIKRYGWAGYNDLDEFQIGAPVYWRDFARNVSLEHTMFTDTQKLWAVAARRGLTDIDGDGRSWKRDFRAWEFNDGRQRPLADSIHNEVMISFWENAAAFDVKWIYDAAKGVYRRVMGGLPHRDPGTGRQITASTILVQFQKESSADDGYPGNVRLLYGTLGAGQAKVIQNGQVTEGSWRKMELRSRTVFRDHYGREVGFQPGKIWVETVPLDGSVTIS